MKTKNFLVPEGKKLDLKDYPTDFTGDYKNKEDAVEDLQKNIEKMKTLQDVLYAQDIYSVLLIFQAMDAAGKDSAIEHVMSGVNPQGCQVTSFKVPSSEELDHDFMWRTTKALPERGRFGIFNRSYYEEVLVVRVHPQILQGQRLPADIKNDKDVWKKRFRDIRNFEEYLHDNGTVILKFFLHVSKDEQKKRFLDRTAEPDKNWKFSAGDVKERGFWDDYMKCYTEAIQETSTEKAPWYIIPADKKWFTRAAVAEVICETLKSLDMKYPVLDEKQMAELQEAKKLLESEK
ncbi:MAG TPA: polyphosphate kinase 2 family protein [Pyrinomonadaceae bacterium]|jgi:PPK2 family polyphosphate:nucleotide phosphotransferase|nr:polyphosphate kinase 2 family protein [Pyrinomonadaceae bacterium]